MEIKIKSISHIPSKLVKKNQDYDRFGPSDSCSGETLLPPPPPPPPPSPLIVTTSTVMCILSYSGQCENTYHMILSTHKKDPNCQWQPADGEKKSELSCPTKLSGIRNNQKFRIRQEREPPERSPLVCFKMHSPFIIGATME